MNTDKTKKWERIRAQGRSRFIWVRGVISWGVITAVLWSIIMSLLGKGPLLLYLAVAIIVFPIGGYIWGAFMWKFSENNYKKYLTDQENQK